VAPGSAANHPCRANPFSLEIADFQTGGELQTVFRSVGPETSPYPPTPWHYVPDTMQRHDTVRFRAQRPIVQSAALRELGNLWFPNSTESRGPASLAALLCCHVGTRDCRQSPASPYLLWAPPLRSRPWELL